MVEGRSTLGTWKNNEKPSRVQNIKFSEKLFIYKEGSFLRPLV
jgi:hypothetical protein